jgi:hypothetical protein
MSNVDLAQEFTSMIVAQRGFQANSRVITNSDEMLQEVVNLKARRGSVGLSSCAIIGFRKESRWSQPCSPWHEARLRKSRDLWERGRARTWRNIAEVSQRHSAPSATFRVPHLRGLF